MGVYRSSKRPYDGNVILIGSCIFVAPISQENNLPLGTPRDT